MKKLFALAVALLVSATATAAGAASISTLPSENSSIGNWGLPDTAAYGQTFTLAAADTLQDVTFRINDRGAAVGFNLLVFGWDGSTGVGPTLANVAGTTAGSSVMTTVTTSTGGVALGAGAYVALLQATTFGSAFWGSVVSSDVYTGGAFVFQNNSGNALQLVGGAYSTNLQGPGSDLAFELTFEETPKVPVPASLPLLATGLGTLALWQRRRA